VLPNRDSRAGAGRPRILHPTALLTVEVAKDAQRVTVHLCGELDFASAPDLASRVPEFPRAVDEVVVDLRRLAFCDVAGMRALHRYCVEQLDAGREVRVIGARPYFRKVSAITGLVPQCREG